MIVGFGHNDEKSDDASRFASANLSTTTECSFKYNINEYYVKLAIEHKATPIICSPIVRLDKTNSYSSSTAHITSNGDYAKAIRELGEELNITTIDLTTLTKDMYQKLGYDESCYFHAMKSGIDDNTPNINSIDTTHINIYGAKMISYLFVNALKNTNCELKNYVNDNITIPTKDKDLIKNKLYKYVAYTSVAVDTYLNYVNNNSKLAHFKTLSSKWFGTAFGDCGGDPTSSGNGYVAIEENNEFIVGQCTSDNKYKGKITKTDGRSYVLQQISIDKNFTIEADAIVIEFVSIDTAGFGLVLRDECYVAQNDGASLKDASIGLGNSFNAGLLLTKNGSVCNFARITENLVYSNNNATSYQKESTAHFKIERVGQIITCIVTYGNNTYTEVYTDVDLAAKDNNYVYVGMFGTRGTIAKFSNVVLTITGDSEGA